MRKVFSILMIMMIPLKALTVPSVIQMKTDTLTLKDVFQGYRGANQEILTPSKDEDSFIPASEVLQIALRNWIDWTPPRGFQGITVRPCSPQNTQMSLRERLDTHLGDVTYSWTPETETLLQKIGKDHEVEIIAIQKDTKDLQITVQNAVGKNFLLQGDLVSENQVPVLSHPLKRGHKIQKEDLTWVSMKSISPGVLRESDQLVGKTIRRPVIKARQPIDKSDVMDAYGTRKNQAITLIAQSSNVFMTTKGKSLENGKLAQVVKVKNLDSGRVIEGKVIGDDLVEVSLPTQWKQTRSSS